jgi:hypothetical protein
MLFDQIVVHLLGAYPETLNMLAKLLAPNDHHSGLDPSLLVTNEHIDSSLLGTVSPAIVAQ